MSKNEFTLEELELIHKVLSGAVELDNNAHMEEWQDDINGVLDKTYQFIKEKTK